jgi:hypothetical protein
MSCPKAQPTMKNKATGNVSRAVIFIASPFVKRPLAGKQNLLFDS